MINLHNHSTWSDGVYPPDHLVKMAILGGLTHIGISDHFFTDKLGPSRAYVDASRLDRYVSAVRDLAKEHADRIQVLVGLEVDWSPRSKARLSNLWQKINQLDYVLFEYVQSAEWEGRSLGSLLAVRASIHIPVGLAHNNLADNMIPPYTPQELADLLQEHGIFVELSTDPVTAYYARDDEANRQVWDALARSEVEFSVGSDTHEFIDQVTAVEDAHLFLDKRGLSERLITNRWDPELHMWRPRQR